MRAAVIVFATVIALSGAGCVSPLFEPLEKPLIFRPRLLDAQQAKALLSEKRVEEVRIATPEGFFLHGWLRHPEHWNPARPHPLVIVYGGVAQEVSEFVHGTTGRKANGSWGWLMVNYRGFGLSGGSPSERSVLSDARRIYDWAAARPDVDRASIVVLGRSLGSYVASAVAASRKVRGAILATPFDSAAALGQQLFGGLPIGWLLQDHYNTAQFAPLIHAPALFVLAEKDEVTPVKNGLALARRWGGRAKTVLVPGAGHSGIEEREEFWSSVGDFLAALDEALATSAAAGSSTNK